MILITTLMLMNSAFAASRGELLECRSMPPSKKTLTSGKHTLEYFEVLNKPKVDPKNHGACNYASVNWKTEWVYLLKFACAGYNDLFAVQSFKNGTLAIELRARESVSKTDPNIHCNALTACSHQVMGVILKKGQKVKNVAVTEKTVPCTRD